MAKYLTAEQIEAAIAALRFRKGETVTRGRGGSGFEHRDGKFYRIYVEDSDREEVELSEAALREILRTLDLDNYSNRYDIWAIQQLGIELQEPPFPAK